MDKNKSRAADGRDALITNKGGRGVGERGRDGHKRGKEGKNGEDKGFHGQWQSKRTLREGEKNTNDNDNRMVTN